MLSLLKSLLRELKPKLDLGVVPRSTASLLCALERGGYGEFVLPALGVVEEARCSGGSCTVCADDCDSFLFRVGAGVGVLGSLSCRGFCAEL